MDFPPYIPDFSTYIFPGAVVVGNVTMGKDCSVWFNAVIRADEATITIGDGTNIQDNAVIHISTNLPVKLGNGVTVGHGAILHACTIGDNTLVGMGAIILDQAVVGKNCIVAAGALITGRTVIPDGSLVMGNPAKVKRALTQDEIDLNQKNAQHYVMRKEKYR